MRTVSRFTRIAAVLAAIATLSFTEVALQAAEPTKDIVDTAVPAGNFTTLATALQAAGLVETLKGPGPFTVFAPTDQALGQAASGDGRGAPEG